MTKKPVYIMGLPIRLSRRRKKPFAVEAVLYRLKVKTMMTMLRYTQPEVVEELEMASLEGRLLAKKSRNFWGRWK